MPRYMLQRVGWKPSPLTGLPVYRYEGGGIIAEVHGESWSPQAETLLLDADSADSADGPDGADGPDDATYGKVEIYEARDGWRWRLRARNGRIVADSAESYTEHRGALHGWGVVTQLATGSVAVDDEAAQDR